MGRYSFLTKNSAYSALNKLRAAFLAAKDGVDVEEIIKGVLTHDERMKIGRRIQIAQMLKAGYTYQEIKDGLKVGAPTIKLIARKIDENPRSFELIEQREVKVERKYKSKSNERLGGSKIIHKKKSFSKYTRKMVQR